MTAAELKALDPSVDAGRRATSRVDLWSRKSDYRPAKFSFSITTAEMGTFGMTLDIKYDVAVAVTPRRPTRSHRDARPRSPPQ